MNETQRRIKAYQDALPGLRERVIAVALLLAMSAAMMTSATFAWITLSRAPEVSNVSTTITSNGNLEIALVKPDGSVPAKSAIGDSSAALGQTVTNANVTWGNLVNLSDSSYGLHNIVLRPALLGDTNNLLSQPLKGVDYGEDGRLQQYYNEDFQFANWTIKDDGSGYFKYNKVPQYGVRAISTVEYTYINNTFFGYTQIQSRVAGMRDYVVDQYSKVTTNQAYINSLAGMIGQFMTDQLNDWDTDVSGYVKDLYHMLRDIYDLMAGTDGLNYCFEDAMAELANSQVYLFYKGTDAYKDNLYTAESLMTATSAELAADGVDLPVLAKYKTLKSNIETILFGKSDTETDCIYDYYRVVYPNLNDDGTVDEDHDSGAEVLRSSLMTYLNKMVDIGTTQITCEGETNTVSELTASKSKAVGLLGKQVDGVIAKGYLKDFEQIVGGRLNAKNVTVSAYYLTTVKITAKSIATGATQPYEFDKDVMATDAKAAADRGEYTGVAQDTYGMALDFWVRTNAQNSYLVLEGNVLTETETIRATGIDKNGSIAELFTVDVSTTYTEDGQDKVATEKVTVYILTEEVDEVEQEVIYDAEKHIALTKTENMTISAPKPLMEEKVTIIGYEGENRVWNSEDKIFLDTDSTTQGNGSCYVFYAEDPAQQDSSLRLLSNLRVAFVDCNENSVTYGKMVATAYLDTKNPYEENGKVTIPLVLEDDGSTYLTKTEDGSVAIIELPQNEATRLMALIYLDGRQITNADVLAASDIHGQLNIQFGSTVDLTPVDDERLEAETRSISAVIKKSTSAEYGSNKTPVTFDYDKETGPMSVDVKVTVTGESPANVTAFFMRKVNANQGSREGTFILTESETEEGVYIGTAIFESPGEYILQTVALDGVDYRLPADDNPASDDEYPRVQISGFGIDDVTLAYNGSTVTDRIKTIMTDKKSITAELSLKFSSDQTKLPGSVRLQFVEQENGTRVTAPMRYDSTTTTWYGSANFAASGKYTLTDVIMDGNYTALDTQYQKTLDISMGLRVRVVDGNLSLRDKLWDGNEYSIPVFVEIFDETGEEIQYLNNVKLYYGAGSDISNEEDPDVLWNAAEGYYAGNILITGPGLYNFIGVDVAGNLLTNTINTPPEFTCTSPNPPEYYDADPASLPTPMADMDYIVDPGDGSLKVGVRLAEASSAKVTAVFKNAEDGKEYRSDAVTTSGNTTIDGVPVSEFIFTIPKTNVTPGQTGDWTIDRLELTNVYANDKMYRDGDPLVMKLTHSEEKNDLHVKVVSLKVTIETADKVRNYTGSFMETKTTGSITLTITDHAGNKLEVPLTDVTVQYLLRGDSWKESSADAVYGGGYDATHLGDQEGVGENDTYELTSSDGKTFTLNSVNLVYAGVYEPKLTFKLNGEEKSYSGVQLTETFKMPIFNLKTAKPTVTVKSVSPSGDVNTTITLTSSYGKLSWGRSGTHNNRVDTTTNTVYARAGIAANNANGNVTYTLPAVTFTVSGVDDESTVSFTITAGDSIPANGSGVTGAASKVTFTKKGNGDAQVTLGKLSGTYINKKSWISTFTAAAYCGHGTKTITTVTITRGTNQTYTVILDKPIIINNPSTVPIDNT